MCLNMAAPAAPLHPKPRSHVMSDPRLPWTPWSSRHGVFTPPYSHMPACSLQTPPRPEQSRWHPSAPLQACAGGDFSWCLFKVLFSCRLTPVLWHEPSFLHGGLVWSYFPAYRDFLGRGWRVGRWGRGTVAFVAEETLLSLTCISNLYSLPHPIRRGGARPFGPQVHPNVYFSPHSSVAFSLGPQTQLAAIVPTTRDPGSKMPLIASTSCVRHAPS